VRNLFIERDENIKIALEHPRGMEVAPKMRVFSNGNSRDKVNISILIYAKRDMVTKGNKKDGHTSSVS